MKKIFKLSFHRWLIRCLPGYSIRLNVTNFQIEKTSDEILLYDATADGNNLIGEITSLGEFETSSSELLISFKSDCDVTEKGFQAVVEFVKNSAEMKINSSIPKTITTSTSPTTKTMQKSTLTTLPLSIDATHSSRTTETTVPSTMIPQTTSFKVFPDPRSYTETLPQSKIYKR